MYSAALRQGDPDWLQFVNTTWNVAMFGHNNAIFDKAFSDYFGLQPPVLAFEPFDVARVRGAFGSHQVADETARFSLPFVDLGLIPEAASSLLLPRLAGREPMLSVAISSSTVDSRK